MSESDFKKWLRNNWSGWIESYEPRRGTGIGIPDVQIVVHGKLVPVELKVGTIRDGILYPKEIRPPQIIWHKRLNDAGVKSLLMIGVYDLVADDFDVCLVDAEYMRNWRHGYKHYARFNSADKARFNQLLTAWCAARLSG